MEVSKLPETSSSTLDAPARPSAELPPDECAPELTSRATSAGGLSAIINAITHTLGQVGTVRGAELLLRVNQKDGFDCPGCAWPEPDEHRSMVEFCENGAKAIGEEATAARATPEFFRRWTVAELAAQSDEWLGKSGRLTHPMFLRAGATHYEPIPWDDAFHLIASHVHALASPDEAAFYTSGRTSNEAAFLYQLFARQFGTNNLPDCSNMCHESSGVALGEVLGRGKGAVTLDDFALADAIFVIGQNPGTNHPRMLTTLQAAARHGCKIVSVNPMFEAGLNHFKQPQEPLALFGPGTALAALHLPVKINGDIALFKGIMKEILAEEARYPGQVLDHDFIARHTSGFEEFRSSLDVADWAEIVEQSGVDRERIRAAARIAMDTRRIICCWAMGLTQHRNSVETIREVVNFLLLRGNLGKPGAGACPIRGHSNVQGDRTMGVWPKMPPAFLDSLAREFGFEPPREEGLDTVNTLHAMHEGRVKVLVAMGGNLLSAAPDTHFTAEALRRCDFTVQISTKLNRSHLVTGREALLLPTLGRTELDLQPAGLQFVTTENSMAVVQQSHGKLNPASEHLRSECAIVAGVAKAVLAEKSTVDWDALAADYDRIRDCIERVIPGFKNYNQRVRRPGGFTLPNPIQNREFPTATGKALFTVNAMTAPDLRSGEFLMMTIRTHDQYNTTIYGLDDRYRGVFGGRRVVFLNADDCRELGFSKGDVVDLASRFAGETRHARSFVVYPYDLPRRCAATYFPEANVLVPIGSVAERSNTPASKSVPITITREDASSA